jgi:hypothetical protein
MSRECPRNSHNSMTLQEATRQYQAVLEYVRSTEPDEDDWTALEEAEREMNATWLKHTVYHRRLPQPWEVNEAIEHKISLNRVMDRTDLAR